MTVVSCTKGHFTLKAYRGDRKTLLAFNLDKAATTGLAGFTIQCQPKGGASYFIYNSLQFKDPADHASVASEPAKSSVNAPIHKFRWVHVPGSVHQGLDPYKGDYTYTVTPRYFDKNESMMPLDAKLSASVTIEVDTYTKGTLTLGFTRGFTQSQAYVNHFGKTAKLQPSGDELLFDTSQQSGQNAAGQKYTFEDQYTWMGFTAREQVFAILQDVLKSKKLSVDVFAYDLNEPDVIEILQKLAQAGRVRLILDNAALHHNKAGSKHEDQVEKIFDKVHGGKDLIKRGHFGRYAHDKVLVVRSGKDCVKVLTGSTNFSITGLYVNSNHVLVFDDTTVAGWYGDIFDAVWDEDVSRAKFLDTEWSKGTYPKDAKGEHLDHNTPATDFTFSPHDKAFATTLLDGIVTRIEKEGGKGVSKGCVLFAVMQIDGEGNPVYTALNALHKDQNVFSYGISDKPDGIYLYPIAKRDGVLVTGKPVDTQLPPPFNQVPNIGGIGHQIHHKFVVCGFNRDDAVVYCGSSNLALGGEQENGDNLLAIHDKDIATVFAIEALSLVDHFDFLDRYSQNKTESDKPAAPVANLEDAAAKEGWFLSTTDDWKNKYYDPNDLHCADRELFGT